jgi:preprotein translocase subunit SecG
MGQAFGGAATDALFGAGSGNALTKLTKWAAGFFFALAIVLTIMGTYKTTGKTGNLQKILTANKPGPTTPVPVPETPQQTLAPTNILNLNMPTNRGVPSTNLVPAPTNAGAAPTNAAAK